MAENITFVPSRLKSSVVGGYVTGADQVYDDTLGKSQAEINSGIDAIVEEKIDEKISGDLGETIEGIVSTQMNEKVPQAVQQQLGSSEFQENLNSTITSQVGQQVNAAKQEIGGQVPTIINQALYGSNSKPYGVELVTTENLQQKVSSVINQVVYNSSTKPDGVENITTENLQQKMTPVINQELYGSIEKPNGAFAVTSENFSDKLSQSLDEAIGTALDGKINSALDEKLENLDVDTNTTYKLSVNGIVKGDVSGDDLGAVYAPVSAGSNGQFLMSNGSGAPVWAEIPAGEQVDAYTKSESDNRFASKSALNTVSGNVSALSGSVGNLSSRIEEVVASIDSGSGVVVEPVSTAGVNWNNFNLR